MKAAHVYAFGVSSAVSGFVSQVVMNCSSYMDENLVESVVDALTKKGLHETCGDLLKHRQKYDEARVMFEK